MNRNYGNRKAINFNDQGSIISCEKSTIYRRNPLKMVPAGKFIDRIVL
jgi:hypothetical protein